MWFGSHTVLNILQINNAQKKHVGLFIFVLYPCVQRVRQAISSFFRGTMEESL